DPVAFQIVYDAFTEPQLYRIYCDDKAPPPGVNRFDLHPYYCKDGRPEDYRSERKGPNKRPRPIGSRMGPQNMVQCGIALQLLAERKWLWQKPYDRDFAKTDRKVPILSGVPRDEAWKQAAVFDLGGAKLQVIAHPKMLRVRGEMDVDQGGTLELFAGPDA